MNFPQTLITLFVIVSFTGCSTKKNYEVVDVKMHPFELEDVSLTPSPFFTAMQQNELWLLSLEPDRFLSGFRSESGLTPKASKYGGWESGGVAGQTFGHYLSACAMNYAATGNEEFNNRLKYCISELDSCQQAFGNGLVAGFPRAKELMAEISAGDIRTMGFDLNGGWVPLYTLHKLFAGLIDVYHYTNNEQAYNVLIKLSDYIVNLCDSLSDEQIQTILVCEHGGINEALANVYGLTGDKRYLIAARRLNHAFVLDPLANRVDQLAGLHANTQIPKVVGVARQFELSGDSSLYTTASFFWNTVVNHHTYVIGGNSEAEHFGTAGRTYDRITDKTCENCNTYNMLKLTKHLYQLEPSIDKVDFYERALYNQILASQNPNNGMVCYMAPLSNGSRRHFSTPFDSFWCCVGTGLENHTRYGEFIYFEDDKHNLYVNLFIPSKLRFAAHDLVIEQDTRFPDSDTITYRIQSDKASSFTLNLRYPRWATQGVQLWVNDEQIESPSSAIGTYLPISRKWCNGDVVRYVLAQPISSEAALGDTTLRAYLRGPIVLSGVLPDDRKIDPVVVTSNITDAQEVVRDNQMIKGAPYNVSMIPYYKTLDNPNMVYFAHYTPEQWSARKEEIMQQQNKERWIKLRTVDHFRPGEMQPERDHNFEGERAEVGEMHGRKFRKAIDGGKFSFTMATDPKAPLDLVCSYWGDFGDIYKFDILIEETPIATVIIHWWGSGFKDKTYHIPAHLTANKERVKVTFKALNEKSVAGPLFDCKIIKR